MGHTLNSIIFGSWLAPFINWGIEIIGSDLREIPMLARRTAINKAKVGPASQEEEVNTADSHHFLNIMGQVLWVTADNRLIPTVEPTIPELRAHKRPLLAMTVEEGLEGLGIARCIRAEVTGDKDIIFNQGAGL